MFIYLDIIFVTFVFVHIIKQRQLNLLNPLLIYLIIHLLFVTIKGIQIFILDKAILMNVNYDKPVDLDEVSKAIFLADIGLLAFAFGFNMFRKRFKTKSKRIVKLYPVFIESRKNIINIYIYVVLILGVFGLLLFGYLPGLGKNQFEGSILTAIMANLSIISAIILIYQKGFNRYSVVYFLALVFVYSLQGYARYRAVLPLLFVLLYYLKVYKLKLPPLKYILIAVLVIPITIPMKEIGMKARIGESINLVDLISDSFNEIFEGDSRELALLEQSAAMVGAVDQKEKIFYGETYSSIFFFFVPRSMWKEKPALNQWQYEISDAGRQFSTMGQVSLVTGEAYANFRYFGVVGILMLLGIFFSFLYFTYSDVHVLHRGFLMLLLFDMILFQIWRDGLVSLFLFPLLNYLPIIALFLIKKPIKINRIKQ